ncbi:hypothetical protein ZHAS_00011975 [Anopheles sinensis]|uniref:Uncharacterized protein n=1 Tax=Anopheles sinensis TaxID=74873 RepID=A0A084W1L0_ANOSI|nr:hypothetical protein ZHAS_00011975 [Anopheles sinensis]
MTEYPICILNECPLDLNSYLRTSKSSSKFLFDGSRSIIDRLLKSLVFFEHHSRASLTTAISCSRVL